MKKLITGLLSILIGFAIIGGVFDYMSVLINIPAWIVFPIFVAAAMLAALFIIAGMSLLSGWFNKENEQ